MFCVMLLFSRGFVSIVCIEGVRVSQRVRELLCVCVYRDGAVMFAKLMYSCCSCALLAAEL